MNEVNKELIDKYTEELTELHISKMFHVPSKFFLGDKMRIKKIEPGPSPKFGEDEWATFVKEEYKKLVAALDEKGDIAPAYVLIDNDNRIVPWKLIWSVNGPCWQNLVDRAQFQGAFTEDGITRYGHREVIILASTNVIVKDGALQVKPDVSTYKTALPAKEITP